MGMIIGGDAIEDAPKVTGRIKNFQRLGCIPHVNTGRGIDASYSLKAVWTVAVLLELHRLGIKREEAVKLLNAAPEWYGINVLERKAITFSVPDRRSQITIDVEWLATIVASIWTEAAQDTAFHQEKRNRDIIDVRPLKRGKKKEAGHG